MNKRGEGRMYNWIYALVSLFGLGILYIVFDQVFMMYLVPTIKNQVNSTAGFVTIDPGTVAQIYGNIDKYIDFWHALPFILFFVVVVFMFVSGIKKEAQDQYTG